MNELDGVSHPTQNRILGMSTLAFTVCFAVWTIFSIIGVKIKQDLGLSDTEFGLLVGTPILTGSLSRIFLGIWTDQYGGRIVYFLTMVSAAAATFLLSFATTYELMLLAALGVGLAGGSFAVGIAYVSKWYPPDKQGTTGIVNLAIDKKTLASLLRMTPHNLSRAFNTLAPYGVIVDGAKISLTKVPDLRVLAKPNPLTDDPDL